MMNLGNTAAHTFSNDISSVPVIIFFLCEIYFTFPLPFIFANREIDDGGQVVSKNPHGTCGMGTNSVPRHSSDFNKNQVKNVSLGCMGPLSSC